MNTLSKNVGAAIIGIASTFNGSTALSDQSSGTSSESPMTSFANPNFSPQLVHELKEETQRIISNLMKNLDTSSEEYGKIEELAKLKEAIIVAYLKSNSQINDEKITPYYQLSEQDRVQRREDISLYGGCFDYLKEVYISSYDTILEICATNSYELLKTGGSLTITNEEGRSGSSLKFTESEINNLRAMLKKAIKGNPEFTKILMEDIKLADEGSENERHKEIYKIFEIFLESMGIVDGEIDISEVIGEIIPEIIPDFISEIISDSFIEGIVTITINELIKSGEEINEEWRYQFMMDYGNDVLGSIAQEKKRTK